MAKSWTSKMLLPEAFNGSNGSESYLTQLKLLVEFKKVKN